MKENNKLTEEIFKQDKCGSCGKYWSMFNCFDEIICFCINRGCFTESKDIEALDIVRGIIQKELGDKA